MALKKDFNLKLGYKTEIDDLKNYLVNILSEEQMTSAELPVEKEFVIPDVYCRIDVMNGSKERLTIKVDTYKDSSKVILIKSESYSFVPDVTEGAENFVKQGYEYLKTLPEFSGAVDC